MITKKLTNDIAKSFEELAIQVRQTKSTERRKYVVLLDQLNLVKQGKLISALNKWEKAFPGSSFIYSITASAKTDIASCYLHFDKARVAKYKQRRYAKLNELPSQTFYIGSSRSLKKRIKEHLGFGYSGTYALHMAYWATKISGSVEIEIHRFDSSIQPSIIQAIEDGLWNKCKPMFGKKGAQ